HQDPLVPEGADEGQQLAVLRAHQLEAAPAEGAVLLAQRDQPAGPVEKGVGIGPLRLDVDRFVVILGVDDDGKEEPLPVGPREAGVAVGTPLHRGPDAVAVPKVDVVPHSCASCATTSTAATATVYSWPKP